MPDDTLENRLATHIFAIFPKVKSMAVSDVVKDWCTRLAKNDPTLTGIKYDSGAR